MTWWKRNGRLIAICGMRRSGKDTLANHIASKYDYEHVKIANHLKTAVASLFDLEHEHVEGHMKDELHIHWRTTPRKIMDFMGTHVFQHEIQKIIPHIGRSFWIDGLIRELDMKNKRYVISDLRFPYEYHRIKEYNPLIVRIENPMVLKNNVGVEKTLLQNRPYPTNDMMVSMGTDEYEYETETEFTKIHPSLIIQSDTAMKMCNSFDIQFDGMII